MAYYKTRNTRHRTMEYGTLVEQQNTLEQWWNNETRCTTFQAIFIVITLLTNRCSTKNRLLWQEIVMMFLSVPKLLKLLANFFLSHRYIFLVTFICWYPCSIEKVMIVHIGVTTNFQGNNRKTKKLQQFCRDIRTLLREPINIKKISYESRVTKDCSPYLKSRET